MQLTLLSDFGLHDPSVAVVKGVLMQYTAIRPVDISHEIKPFYMPQAAYLLSAAYPNFPKGSCHLLLFDLFSATQPRLVLSEYEGHYFLSPDNGLLPLSLGRLPESSHLYYELGKGDSFISWLHAAGRAIQQLETGEKPNNLPLCTLMENAATSAPPYTTTIPCSVLHIDHYENVVLNFTRQQYNAFLKDRPFLLQFMQVEEISQISTHYNDVREGYKLCRFNSNGYLEICVNRGKAASLFGLKLGSKHNDIKISLA